MFPSTLPGHSHFTHLDIPSDLARVRCQSSITAKWLKTVSSPLVVWPCLSSNNPPVHCSLFVIGISFRDMDMECAVQFCVRLNVMFWNDGLGRWHRHIFPISPSEKLWADSLFPQLLPRQNNVQGEWYGLLVLHHLRCIHHSTQFGAEVHYAVKCRLVWLGILALLLLTLLPIVNLINCLSWWLSADHSQSHFCSFWLS